MMNVVGVVAVVVGVDDSGDDDNNDEFDDNNSDDDDDDDDVDVDDNGIKQNQFWNLMFELLLTTVFFLLSLLL